MGMGMIFFLFIKKVLYNLSVSGILFPAGAVVLFPLNEIAGLAISRGRRFLSGGRF
jgi:hypothetical protein